MEQKILWSRCITGKGTNCFYLFMWISAMKCFVTWWAWFIGSHIVDRLLEEWHSVVVYDNFSTWQEIFIQHHLDDPNFSLVRWDILHPSLLISSMQWADFVFHLAANADVKWGVVNTDIDFQQNTIWTKNVLEAMRMNWVKKIAFSSSATVYGEPSIFPTPETCPLIQTSLYWASKLSCEAMIHAYCEYYGMKSWIFRFVSWIGERYTHGVIFDFMKKLSKNPSELKILWDGHQKKSYLYVKDWVEWIFFAIKNFDDKVNTFNLGHKDFMNVLDLASIVTDTMWLKEVKHILWWGVRWRLGDSPFVHLDISKLQSRWWEPKTTIQEGIQHTVAYLLEHKDLFDLRT